MENSFSRLVLELGEKIEDIWWQSEFQTLAWVAEAAFVCVSAPSVVTPGTVPPTRLLCPWTLRVKQHWSGSHSLRQGVFLTQGSNPSLLLCRQILLSSEPPGKPRAPWCLRDAVWPEASPSRDRPWSQPLSCFLFCSPPFPFGKISGVFVWL